jgi:DNA-binding NtrC family response regulator
MAKLLVVDDEVSLCRLLKDTFGKGGHEADAVTSGQGAKEKIDSHTYDLVITDIRMPDVTGLELLEHARAIKSRARFVLMTAVPTLTTAIQAVNLGAYRYVIKSESFVEELVSVVEGALKENALRQ